MTAFIPMWIIGGPVIGLLYLAFAFKGPSAMGGSGPRERELAVDRSTPLLEPMVADAQRRLV